jgi:hypothetical protein
MQLKQIKTDETATSIEETNLCECWNQWACSSFPCKNLEEHVLVIEYQVTMFASFEMPFLFLKLAPEASFFYAKLNKPTITISKHRYNAIK